MRIKAHIYLDGYVGTPMNSWLTEEPFFTPIDVRNKIEENRGAEEYIIHINSGGGNVFDAFAIHDMLSRIKNVTTLGEGIVASAATIILLAGKSRQMTRHCEFMIHNPVIGTEGDAEELHETADNVQRIEDKITEFYSQKTGIPVAKLDKWMTKDKFMSAEEALELGFITEIAEPLRVVATFSNSNSQNSLIMNLFEKIKAEMSDLKATVLGTPKNLELTNAEGKKFSVDTETNSDKATPEVNNVVTIDGKAATDGDIIVPVMGKTLTVAGGKITAIKDTNEAGADATEGGAKEDSPEVKALKDQLAASQKTIGELNAKVTEQEKIVNEVTTDIQMIKANIVSGGFVVKDRTQNFNRSTDKKEKPKNAFEAAAEERKARREKENESRK